MISTYTKSTTITKLIVESGRVDIDETNDEGWTALMLSARFAGTKSTTAILKTLIDAGASLDMMADNGWTALMMAAFYSAHESCEEAVRLLLEAGADPGIERPDDGCTPLMLSVRACGTTGTANTVKMIANHLRAASAPSAAAPSAAVPAGAAPSAAVPRDSDGDGEDDSTISSTSTSTSDISSTDPCNINYRDYKDTTALMYAVCKPNAMKILLEAGADPNLRQERGHNALMLAILTDGDANIKTIKMLLKHPDIDVNAQDENGNTALNLAILCKCPMIVQVLIQHPNVDLNVENNDHKTALTLATDKNTVKQLVNAPDIILVPCDLIHSLDTKTPDAIRVLIAAYKKANLLNGQCPSNGDTALIHVTKKNNLLLQKQLLEAGADVTVKNAQQETAWMIASTNGFPTAQLEAALDRVSVHHEEEPPPAYTV